MEGVGKTVPRAPVNRYRIYMFRQFVQINGGHGYYERRRMNMHKTAQSELVGGCGAVLGCRWPPP